MKTAIRAVGFDLGDTLLYYRDTPPNWASLYRDALRAVAARCQASPSPEQLSAAENILARYNTRLTPRTSEVRAGEILGEILRSWGLTGSAPANGAIEEFFAFFQQRLSVYPDTLDTLKRLRSRTIPLGILTDVPYGMPREFVQRDLGAGGISGLIDVLLTSVDVGVRKPETAGYLALAERLGVTPGEMLYVGNEPKDVIGAGRAGLQSAFINRAGVGGDHGQQFTVSTLNAIAEIVIAAEWSPRLATENDIADLEELIPISARALQAPFYSRAQIDAALGPIFGVDTQLIRDGTYFVVEHEGRIIGCGGWSRRKSMYGGDGQRAQSDPELDPQRDAARVRAFFVHPRWARRGIGRSLMNACEQAIAAAGFRNVEIAATLAGEPLYASFGYVVTERCEVAMANGLKLPVARMTRTFGT